MKKPYLICLLAALALTFTACTAKPEEPAGDNTEKEAVETEADAETEEETEETDAEEEPAEFTGLANPMTAYDNLDDLNAVNGTHLCHPGVMGVSDEQFFSIDCGEYTIAEYKFAVNGTKYVVMRTAPVTEDICGIWNGEKTVFDGVEQDDDYVIISTDEYKLARWFTLDGQYTLCVKDGGEMDDTTFAGIVDEMYYLTNVYVKSPAEQEAFYAELAGAYEDSVSRRASLDVTANGADDMKFLVSWGNSAAETVTWEMTVKESEDGLLSYKDCVKTIHNFETEEEVATVEYENGEGFFSISEGGSICWNGAAEESCTECVFEKIPEVVEE